MPAVYESSVGRAMFAQIQQIQVENVFLRL